MQNHQQWLENKIYEHHLNCLMKIKSSKRTQHLKTTNRGRNECKTQHHHKSHENSPKNSKHKSKNNQMTLKEKSICWENFLLGKRIIETNPVIVQKKQIDDYNRNRKILDLRGKKQKKSGIKSHFRQSKFQEFTINNFRINERFRLETAFKFKKIMTFKIQSFCFHHLKINAKDLFLQYKFQGKRHWLQTQIIDYKNLLGYTFYFTHLKHKKQDNNIHIQIIEIRGLTQFLVGAFVMPLNQAKNDQLAENQKAQLYRYGKLLGEVEYNYKIIRKKQIDDTF